MRPMRYVLHRYEIEEMCDEVVDNYAHAVEFVPNCYKSQKICNKAVNTYLSTIRFVPECYKTQEMCDKAANTFFIVFSYHISEDPFMLIIHCPDRYKTQKKCDESVDHCQAALKLVLDWFVTSKMLETFHDTILANDDNFRTLF